jgi:hypothetical protein
MKQVAPFLLVIVTVFSVLAFSAVMYVKTADGFSAKAEPSRLEAWLARKAREMAIPRNARSQKNPVRNSAEVLSEARAHWAGVDPSVETKCHGHTCRSTIFPTQIASSPSRWFTAGEAEAGSGGDQPAKESPAGDSSRRWSGEPVSPGSPCLCNPTSD